MPKLKLSYFDFNGGRGEVARLAMSIGGIPFEDDRIPVASWSTVKQNMPLHAVPVLEIDGQPMTQSNAINRFVGKMADLYPDDALQAARCDEIMDAVEDIVAQVVRTFGMEDQEVLRAVREALADGPITLYLRKLNEMLVAGSSGYFAGDRLTVADLKVFVWIRSLRAGLLDYIPAGLTERIAPQLAEHCGLVGSHPGVAAYYDR